MVAVAMKRGSAAGKEEHHRADHGREGRKSRVDREQLAHLFVEAEETVRSGRTNAGVPIREAAGIFTFTTRLRDTAFKRVLQTMPLGTSPGHDLTGPIYYIAGPPQMVAGLRMMLNKAGIDDDDIRTEEFTGY
jgi:hypothetical protein